MRYSEPGSDICTCPRFGALDQTPGISNPGAIVPPGVKGQDQESGGRYWAWGGIPPEVGVCIRGGMSFTGRLAKMLRLRGRGLLVQQNVRSRTESRARARNGLRFPDEWCYMNFTMQNSLC